MKRTTLKNSLLITLIIALLFSCSNALNEKNDIASKDEKELGYLFKEDFEGSLDNSLWTLNGINAKIIDKDEKLFQYIQYANALTDYHKKIVKLAKTDESNTKTGISNLTLNKINVSQESALSFDYKTDIKNKDDISIYVDGKKIEHEFFGISQVWRNYSIILQPGTHKVEWFVGKDSSSSSFDTGDIKNALYLDNITVAPNIVKSVEVFPKGLQETYVNGFDLNFTAKALRSDGTEIVGKNATFTTSGGSIDNNGLFKPGTSQGTFKVIATIDEITGSNETVKVHKANYLGDPVTIAGITFTGSDKEYTIEELTGEIYADGFIVSKGSTDKNFSINVFDVEDAEESDAKDYYLEAGNYYQRIWLFGNSTTQTIKVKKIEGLKRSDTGDSRYKGDFDQSSEWKPSPFSNATIHPKKAEKEKDESLYYLLPSYFCQSDDFIVSNVANSIKASLPKNATEGDILRAIHDWQVKNLHYDDDSLKDKGIRRKAQDSVSVVKYKMAVCEGYANLFTALERLFKIKGKQISSSELAHAWNNTFYNGKWLLVDTTWDDGEDTSAEDYTENYKYFLLTEEQDLAYLNSHSCTDSVSDFR